tara:strand:+ start:509 stop:868 length:360 start_codon:yes stop_codon:yes gene_type:complete
MGASAVSGASETLTSASGPEQFGFPGNEHADKAVAMSNAASPKLFTASCNACISGLILYPPSSGLKHLYHSTETDVHYIEREMPKIDRFLHTCYPCVGNAASEASFQRVAASKGEVFGR